MSQTPSEPEGRRPLKSRDVEFFRALARTLAAAGATSNGISFASMLFGCGAGVAFALTSHFGGWVARGCFIAAAAMIQLRLVCNLIDGLVAVECGRKTATGDLWNEAPDRVSDAATLIGAGYAMGGRPEFGYIAAVLAVSTAYVRALGASLGAGQIFDGPGAKPQRMAVCTAGALLCAFLPFTFPLMRGVLLAVIALSGLTLVIRLRKLTAFLRNQSS